MMNINNLKNVDNRDGVIIQNHGTIINANIDTLIKNIKKDFHDGNFSQSMQNLDRALSENKHNREVTFQLLLVKTSFLFEYRKFDEANEYIDLFEAKYSDLIDILAFKELKLTLLSISGNNVFFNLSKEVRLETPNSKPQSHFDILFYLNNEKLDIAKELFDKEIQNSTHRDKILLLGGLIYSDLYKYEDNNMDAFNLADKYYQEALEKNDLSFLDKLHIQRFYGSYTMNEQIRQKTNITEKLLEELKAYNNSLEIILINKEYFAIEYSEHLSENYINSLLGLGLIDKYLDYYEKNQKNLAIRYYIQYCNIKKIELDHDKIQNHIITDFNLSDLLIYISIRNNTNTQILICFLEKHKEYLYLDSFILFHYIKGKSYLNEPIDGDIVNYIKDNKYQDLDILFSYFEISTETNKVDIDKLVEFNQDNNILLFRVLTSIKILQQNNRQKLYISLALDKQEIYSDIIFKTLKIAIDDENLRLHLFENFIDKIKNKKSYNLLIGENYLRYNKLDIAFNYYYLEYQQTKRVDVILWLLNLSLVMYQEHGSIFQEVKQTEVFNYIITDDSLSIHNLTFLLAYSTFVKKDTRQILPMLNQKLLEIDIKNMDNESKIYLSNLYFNISTDFSLHNIFDYHDNFCLVNDGKTFVRNQYTISDENKKNFGFYSISDNEYFIKQQNELFVEQSLFHRIVGPFAYRCDNPQMKTIKLNLESENPFANLFKILGEMGAKRKEQFEAYNNDKAIGFQSLAHHEYKNYLTLIPYLLKHEKLYLNSGYINILPTDKNKILTFSSIIFLDHIGYLDVILKREDIYVQYTLINWLKSYSQKVTYNEMPIVFNYLDKEEDNKFKLHIDTKEEVQIVKEKILSLTNKIIINCKIVDDHLEVLPFKDIDETLAPMIGRQEYQALAYSLNHNYQIITEDNILDSLYKPLKYNETYISNSLSLLESSLKYEKLRDLKIKLHHQGYKYVLPKSYLNQLITFMEKDDIKNLENKEKELLVILDTYGWLDKVKSYYKNKFMVLFPKVNLPIYTRFDKNIEELLKIINNNKRDDKK